MSEVFDRLVKRLKGRQASLDRGQVRRFERGDLRFQRHDVIGIHPDRSIKIGDGGALRGDGVLHRRDGGSVRGNQESHSEKEIDMAGKSDTYEYQFLLQTFCGKAIDNISATGGTTQLWAGLHTVDPGDAGSTANEGQYSAYTRIAVDRSTAGWTVTSGTGAAVATVSPTSAITFPQVTTIGAQTFVSGSVWTSSNVGSSGMTYFGALNPNIIIGLNVTPIITTGSSITED